MTRRGRPRFGGHEEKKGRPADFDEVAELAFVPGSFDDTSIARLVAELGEALGFVEPVTWRLVEETAGTNRRGRLRIEASGSALPRALFVKLNGRGRARAALVALGAVRSEARLVLSGLRIGCEHPCFYAAGVSARMLRTVVVMEDVIASGGQPNDPRHALSVEEVASGLAGLARQHALYWEKTDDDRLFFVRPWSLGRVWAPLSLASLSRGIGRLRRAGKGDLMPSGVTAGLLERQFRASGRLAAQGEQTILHGDPHPGNSYRSPRGETGFYDFQLIRRGSFVHDLSYFLAGSLSVDDRRTHELQLVGSYLDVLSAGGIAPPPLREVFEAHRLAPAFGLATWLHTLSFGSFQHEDACLAMIERFAAAYADLETSKALARHP